MYLYIYIYYIYIYIYINVYILINWEVQLEIKFQITKILSIQYMLRTKFHLLQTLIPVNVRIVCAKLWTLEIVNYREARSTNFNKAFALIKAGLNNWIEYLASKSKYNVTNFDQWKKMILVKINLKTENLLKKLTIF